MLILKVILVCILYILFINIYLYFKENRNWIHPPEALQKGHIAYIVKVRVKNIEFILFQ